MSVHVSLSRSLKPGSLGKRERQGKKLEVSPEPYNKTRTGKFLKKTERVKRLAFISRVDPVTPNGLYLYTVKGTNEQLDVDQLVKTYGGDAQLAILEFDETQQFNFDVQEVVSEELMDGRAEATIRFRGYSSHFDMKIWVDECTYDGFDEAYARFKGAKTLDTTVKSSPIVIDDDELYLEDMDCDSDPIVKQPVPKEKEECNAIPSLEMMPEKIATVPEEKYAWKKRKAKQAKHNEAAMQAECISDEESSDALPQATKKKLTKAQFKRKIVDPQNSSDLRTQGALAGLFFQSTDTEDTFLCKLCDKGKKAGGNSSNLVKHLVLVHGSEWDKCRKDHRGGNDAKKFVQDIVSARRGGEKKQLLG